MKTQRREPLGLTESLKAATVAVKARSLDGSGAPSAKLIDLAARSGIARHALLP